MKSRAHACCECNLKGQRDLLQRGRRAATTAAGTRGPARRMRRPSASGCSRLTATPARGRCWASLGTTAERPGSATTSSPGCCTRTSAASEEPRTRSSASPTRSDGSTAPRAFDHTFCPPARRVQYVVWVRVAQAKEFKQKNSGERKKEMTTQGRRGPREGQMLLPNSFVSRRLTFCHGSQTSRTLGWAARVVLCTCVSASVCARQSSRAHTVVLEVVDSRRGPPTVATPRLLFFRSSPLWVFTLPGGCEAFAHTPTRGCVATDSSSAQGLPLIGRRLTCSHTHTHRSPTALGLAHLMPWGSCR